MKIKLNGNTGRRAARREAERTLIAAVCALGVMLGVKWGAMPELSTLALAAKLAPVSAVEANYTPASCFKYTKSDNGITITGLTDEGEKFSDISIPSEIDGMKVTSIDDYAFNGCTSLTSISIPDGVKRISYAMFNNCESLTSISIPNSVTLIRECVFDGCSSLTSISIPDGVTSIGDWAFYDCTSLTSISIPDGVTSIYSYAFTCCSSLTSISIPNSVTWIGEKAFYCCRSLTSISIPDSVTKIGPGAFLFCSDLKTASLPAHLNTDEVKACFPSITTLTFRS